MTPGLVTLLLYPDMERATTCNLVIDRGVAPDLLIPPLRKRMQFATDVLMSLRCLATYFSDISTAVLVAATRTGSSRYLYRRSNPYRTTRGYLYRAGTTSTVQYSYGQETILRYSTRRN